MNKLLVGYDLNKSGQNYDDLIELLKSQPNWWHHLDSTWIVVTTMSAAEMRDEVVGRRFIDANDEVFVVDITGDEAAWYGFSEKGSKWLEDKL